MLDSLTSPELVADKSKSLHLPNMWIQGFRGIPDLTIPNLGRVNLIAGKNGTGKTTILDAVKVYAARGRYFVLANILGNREELVELLDEDGDIFLYPNLEALYHGRNAGPDTPISLGPMDPKYRVTIRIAKYRVNEQRNEVTFGIETIESTFMGVKEEFEVANNPIGERLVVRRRDLFPSFDSDDSELPHAVICESLGPNVLSNGDIARFWDSVALTDSENLAVDALNLVYDGVVERVAMIGDGRGRSYIRRAVVKVEGVRRPVPLRSLGDGAVRIFGIALTLANIMADFSCWTRWKTGFITPYSVISGK